MRKALTNGYNWHAGRCGGCAAGLRPRTTLVRARTREKLKAVGPARAARGESGCAGCECIVRCSVKAAGVARSRGRAWGHANNGAGPVQLLAPGAACCPPRVTRNGANAERCGVFCSCTIRACQGWRCCCHRECAFHDYTPTITLAVPLPAKLPWCWGLTFVKYFLRGAGEVGSMGAQNVQRWRALGWRPRSDTATVGLHCRTM